MVQWVKVLAAKLDDPSLIPENGRTELTLKSCLLTSTVYYIACDPACSE